jgi:GNAT superfamily N-acetyltransferase
VTTTPEQATSADAPAIAELRAEARRWLASIGSDQWSAPPHYDPASPHGIEAGIARGEVYVIRDGDSVTATMTVDDHADAEFWTPEDRPDEALYVHRMIVARAARGRDLGGLMLDFATEVAAEAGKRWLRLDAWRSNVALQNYYLGKGFTHVRTVDLPHRGSGALFQRPTGVE